MTETAGIASSRVVSFVGAAVWIRALMPQKTMPATISTASTRRTTTRSVRGRAGGGTGRLAWGVSTIGSRSSISSLFSVSSLFSIDGHPLPMQHAEHSGHEEQSGDGGANQTADHCAAERSVLFAAFAQAQRHRDHTDDHGERGHENLSLI